ncbi:MAG: hypothetical protein U0V74_02590 [Chitinophagales bacterium]
MKNTFFALLLLATSLCSAQAINKDLLIGKWQFVQLQNGDNITHVDSMQKALTENYKGLAMNGPVSKADSLDAEAQIKAEFDALKKIFMEFTKDGAFKARVGTAANMYEVKNATYKWENDKLISMYEHDKNEQESWEIELLTESKLILKESHDDSFTLIEFKR